ncbi:MAG: hypothetical protein A2096_03685, partial [Spirochaetes bacterium GWF1_41_5]
AGLPRMENGETVFPMQAEEFAKWAPEFIACGVKLIGGCCGTTPEFIVQIKKNISSLRPAEKTHDNGILHLSGPRSTVSAGTESGLLIIGERINPTGKKKLQQEFLAGNLELASAFAEEQARSGANLLDINAGMPGIDEKKTMLNLIRRICIISDLPLCIDTTSPEILEKALRLYPGKALVNSLSLEAVRLLSLAAIKKYGAAYILLPLDDHGIPESTEGRITLIEKLLEKCRAEGIDEGRAVIDGLAMSIAAGQNNAHITLDLISHASARKLHSVIGLSNISYGLPGRPELNSAFLAMACGRGLSFVIANPQEEIITRMRFSADALLGKDAQCKKYINAFSGAVVSASEKPAGPDINSRLYNAVLRGSKDTVQTLVDEARALGIDPFLIIRDIMVPAIQEAGSRYDKKEFFLPQLVAAAETMERGVALLRPFIEKQAQEKRGIILLASVKGDIHDIGKNIVSLLLRNNGYDIIDLGKSVDEKTIAREAKEKKADIIGLSALMTTTMTEMKTVINELKKQQIKSRIMVGGAVVNSAFAESIGAHGYAPDAVKAVKEADRLMERKLEK